MYIGSFAGKVKQGQPFNNRSLLQQEQESLCVTAEKVIDDNETTDFSTELFSVASRQTIYGPQERPLKARYKQNG